MRFDWYQASIHLVEPEMDQPASSQKAQEGPHHTHKGPRYARSPGILVHSR